MVTRRRFLIYFSTFAAVFNSIQVSGKSKEKLLSPLNNNEVHVHDGWVLRMDDIAEIRHEK